MEITIADATAPRHIASEMANHPRTAEISLGALLRNMGDPVRLEIVAVLATEGEQTCGPLAERLGIPQSTLSHHLRLLRECGATYTRRDGTLRRVSLRAEDLGVRFPGLLSAITTAIGAPSTRGAVLPPTGP